MADMNDVINGLEQCLKDGDAEAACTQCPYRKYARAGLNDSCLGRLMRDALALVRGKITVWVPEPDRNNHYHCGACGYVEGITARMHNYCPNCGRRVEGKVERL